jgi:hypothetical protein
MGIEAQPHGKHDLRCRIPTTYLEYEEEPSSGPTAPLQRSLLEISSPPCSPDCFRSDGSASRGDMVVVPYAIASQLIGVGAFIAFAVAAVVS